MPLKDLIPDNEKTLEEAREMGDWTKQDRGSMQIYNKEWIIESLKYFYNNENERLYTSNYNANKNYPSVFIADKYLDKTLDETLKELNLYQKPVETSLALFKYNSKVELMQTNHGIRKHFVISDIDDICKTACGITKNTLKDYTIGYKKLKCLEKNEICTKCLKGIKTQNNNITLNLLNDMSKKTRLTPTGTKDKNDKYHYGVLTLNKWEMIMSKFDYEEKILIKSFSDKIVIEKDN